MSNNTIPKNFDNTITGAAAEGHGALVGWSGCGALERRYIVQGLHMANLPTGWAPRPHSAIACAGRSLKALKSRGYVIRRARAKDKAAKDASTSRARWVVFRANSMEGKVGDVAGEIVLTAEITSEGELDIVGDKALSESVRVDFEHRRDEEVYSAGDVTRWLKSLLVSECGVTTFGVGYYVPARHRALASRIVGAIAPLWGAGWINPLLPVATCDELRQGIARGFLDELRTVANGIQDLNVPDSRMLADLRDITFRASQFRELGGDMMKPVFDLANELATQVDSDAPSSRYAMLELDKRAPVPTSSLKRSLAERSADAAADARRSK